MLSFHSEATWWSRVLVCSSRTHSHHGGMYPLSIRLAFWTSHVAPSKFFTLVYQTCFQFHAMTSQWRVYFSLSHFKQAIPLALAYFLTQRFMGFQKPVPTGSAPLPTTSTIWRTWNSLSMFDLMFASIWASSPSLSPMLPMFQVPLWHRSSPRHQELNTSDLLDTPFVRAIMSSSCMGTVMLMSRHLIIERNKIQQPLAFFPRRKTSRYTIIHNIFYKEPLVLPQIWTHHTWFPTFCNTVL